MSVCRSVGLSVGLSVTFTHNSVIFAPRSFKFCVVVDIEVQINDDDDNDDEDDYSRFRVFGHNSPKNNFLGLKPKNELFLCKNITFLLNKLCSKIKLTFLPFLGASGAFRDQKSHKMHNCQYIELGMVSFCHILLIF